MEDIVGRCFDVYCDIFVKQNLIGKGKVKGRKKVIDGESFKVFLVK